jgi:hypothetical protein
VLVDAALKAESNGEDVIIAFGQDGNAAQNSGKENFHAFDGLAWTSDTHTSSYPASAFVGQTPNAGGYQGTGSVLNEYCGVYEALAWLQAGGVNMGRVAVEPFNEPENNYETAVNAANDWVWANDAAGYWGDWTFAGVFASGGSSGYEWNYVNAYLTQIQADSVSPAHWSFHDYIDVANQDPSFTQAWDMDWWLGHFGLPSNDVWATESSLNNYPDPNGIDLCNVSIQQGEARSWLGLLRSGLVEHLFWYAWPGAGSVGGMYNLSTNSCGGEPGQSPMQSYWTLDDQG